MPAGTHHRQEPRVVMALVSAAADMMAADGLPAGSLPKRLKPEERGAAVDRTPRVSSNARQVLVGITVLIIVCAAMARAGSNAPDWSASQAQPVDPAANVWLVFV